MKKIFFILIFIAIFVHADTLNENYNEYKNQLYFVNGNGIFIKSEKDTKKAVLGYKR